MQKKAQAFIWLTVMVMIFGMALIYIMLDQPYQKINEQLGGNFTGTQYENTYKRMNTIWNMWLLIFLIGIIIWGILSSMRQRGEYGI